jgi:GAF domain-containing protein
MALVILVIFLLAQALLRPVRRLTEAAIKIERGDLRTPIPQFPPDEVGQLSSVLSHVVGMLLGRLGQLSAAVQVSRTATMTLDINQILESITKVLAQQFGYPDVRIYLTDMTGRRVQLKAASGSESDRLLRDKHRLWIDETSLVGRAILMNEVQTGSSKQGFREAGFVAENSELALPLQVAGKSIGALHLIAGRDQEFGREDIDILRLITDQLSASIQNARLFEQSASSLTEIEALNRAMTHRAWESYIGEGGRLRHTPDPEQLWPQVKSDIYGSSEVKAQVYADADGRLVLAVPLVLRGETIGTLAVTRPPSENWSRDEALLLESIAARMSIIAEGIRLVEESSQRAEREERVNEISATLLQRATSVETVLRSALNELGGALGSDRVSLRIGNVPSRDGRQIVSASAEEVVVSEDAPSGSEINVLPGEPEVGESGGIIDDQQ